MSITIYKKKTVKPSTMLAPLPAVMVSCQNTGSRPNIITVAWAGTICSEPPMLSISVCPTRHSYSLIKNSGEFAVNLVNKGIAEACDYCGMVSGRDVDKFHETGLTPVKAQVIGAPLIQESLINIECKVDKEIELGSHSLFLAKVVSVSVDQSLFDDKGAIHTERANLVGFAHGHYYQLTKCLGSFGFSMKKN